jgi:tRNA pseudouridine38-40 synthase
MRLALGIEYDGKEFHGWQIQPGLRTVQDTVQQAVSKIADKDVRVVCAGRTDTGVHASGQVVHFDADVERNIRAWTIGVNSYLPKDVSVRWGAVVNEDFHARFSAAQRRYRYLIFNHPHRPSLFQGNVTWQYRPLDEMLMRKAAKHLLGTHDFTSYRAIFCQSKTAVRTIKRLNVSRRGDLIIIDICADAFLHHMVRNIVGALMAVGHERHNTDWTKTLLEAKDRTLGAETAPAYGLYLVDVGYPDKWDLPRFEVGPMFLKEFSI